MILILLISFFSIRPLRTPEELSELFQLAKLNELDLSNVTQILYSEKANDFSDIKLIELDKELLKAVEAGDR